MFSRLPSFWLGLVLTAFALPSPAAESPKIDFNFQIRPLLSDRCFTCHGPDSRARKKELRLDTKDGLFKSLEDGQFVVKPGDTNKSELIRRIFATDDDQMPPEKSHRVLSAADKDLLKRWVDQGAEYKPLWSFIPVEKIAPPKHTSSWAKNPIDDFVAAKLAAENLSPSRVAPRETLLRRLSLDLTGLPPTSEDVDYFTSDPSPDAYDRFVDKYLASPAYGERMALDWLDLARYADTYGYQQDEARDVSPWRDWVIQAFNTNLRYDEFLRWQIAGDLLPHATREQRLATAFNRLHRQTNEGGSIDDEFRAEYAADRVNTFGTAMLGLTVGCARCHDHKFDPITQKDYYSLFAYFNNLDEAGMYSHFTRATPTPTLWLWTPEQEKHYAAVSNQIVEAKVRLEKVANDAAPDFEKWLKTGKLKPATPIAHFKFDEVNSNTTPDACSTNVAKFEDGIELVDGSPCGYQSGSGHALKFSGDSELVCKSVPEFHRTDAFSFSLWIKPAEIQDRAIILHQSRAREDAGSRGFELALDHGQPFFALAHFWPGDAIAVCAKKTLPTNVWAHLIVTYDGSSQASHIMIFLDGQPLETEIVRRHLDKDIVHRAEWGDMEVGKVHLTLGARFRDSGFKNGVIDDLQVFDADLTFPDIMFLIKEGGSLPMLATDLLGDWHPGYEDLRYYYLTHENQFYRNGLAALKKLRVEKDGIADNVREIMTMQELPKPRVTHLLKRGAYDAPGDIVEPDTPSFMAKLPAAPRNRLGLADWLVDRKNPLTARVAVNRIWKLHFGRGLVATPDDFGSQGKLPTNPELLDYLAGWFMDNAWDVKALHRLIVSSATYQQTSVASKELAERDPDNALLARGPKTRLLAEEIRDGALAASGLLVTNLGGSSVKIYQPDGLWEQSGTGAKYTQDHGDKLYRRSLYTFWKRTSPPPSMLTFDAVTREVCTAKRETTATPLQALVLLNDPQFIEAARVLGESLLKQFPNDASARAAVAFKKLIGREPDATETKILIQLFTEQKELFAKDETSAKKLLATGESKFDQTLPPADFAATTLMVNAIMNFDEFIVER